MQQPVRVHRLLLDMPQVTGRAPNGEEIVEWVPFAEVPASIEPIKGTETMRQERPIGEIDTRIRTRWHPQLDQVTSKWRARFGDVIYDIKAVAHVALRHRELQMMCSSGVNAG